MENALHLLYFGEPVSIFYFSVASYKLRNQILKREICLHKKYIIQHKTEECGEDFRYFLKMLLLTSHQSQANP